MIYKDPIAILQQAIAIIQRAESLLTEVSAKLDRLDAPTVIPEWIDKHSAAKIVCKHWKTLDRWRVSPGSTLINDIHWQNDGDEIVYHAELLKDWYRHRSDPIAHQRAIDYFLASLPSNQPKKHGRKAF
jgi:hypothetical protein